MTYTINHPSPGSEMTELATVVARTFHGLPQGIIFDCDGVLVDSQKANIRYYNLLREGVGLPSLTPELERFVQMSTGQQAVDAIIPSSLRPMLRDVARNISYSRDIQPFIEPMPHLHDFVQECKSYGLQLGIHTNRLDTMPELLEQIGLSNVFNPVMTAGDAPPKPDPSGSRTILKQWNLPGKDVLFIGDSFTDEHAAQGAGIPFLAFGSPELTSIACCHSFADLLTAFRFIHSF